MWNPYKTALDQFSVNVLESQYDAAKLHEFSLLLCKKTVDSLPKMIFWKDGCTLMKIPLFGKLSIFAVLLFLAATICAQESQREPQRNTPPPVFFAAPVVEAMGYGRMVPSMGYGLALGTEDKVSIGLKGIYAASIEEADENIAALEITFFVRLYLSEADTIGGLFAQLSYGFAVFSQNEEITLPAESASISAGITAGWRFLPGNNFFIEPYIRAGYPYIIGAGLSVGVIF